MLTLKVKFPRRDLAAVLEPGDGVEVTVTGTLEDGTTLIGTDVLRVLGGS